MMNKWWIALIGMIFGMMAGERNSKPKAPDELLVKVDHLVYGTPDLDAGIERLANLLGVRATPGGQHPGRGTRNALIALGPACYLEIIGPDPQQPNPNSPRPFGIDTLSAPKLVAWAAKGKDLEQLVSEAGRRGVKLGEVLSGSRQRPDGVVLSWRYTDPHTSVAGGIVPFFIDWGKTPHPASSAVAGVSLIGLRAEHPDSGRVREMLGQLGLPLPLQPGPAPAILATVSCPRGRVELR
ncbi:MAG: VOC family protein [Acidobacteriia bacterium]|nr:VOC family protein [Terriglobia bacterium]